MLGEYAQLLGHGYIGTQCGKILMPEQAMHLMRERAGAMPQRDER